MNWQDTIRNQQDNPPRPEPPLCEWCGEAPLDGLTWSIYEGAWLCAECYSIYFEELEEEE